MGTDDIFNGKLTGWIERRAHSLLLGVLAGISVPVMKECMCYVNTLRSSTICDTLCCYSNKVVVIH